MANQTVSVNRNIDDAAIAGLLNGEDITIDTDAILTRNSDSRWGQQAAVVGAITISSTTGGKLLDDGTTVWWVPFDASSGVVPALGTVGVHDSTGGTSGQTGEFLGIWTALATAPLAAAAAMPSSGFVKFRSVSGAFTDNEIITLPGGATITVNSASGGERGWLNIVHEEANAITVPRLGSHEINGDWFYLGTATGVADEQFLYYVLDQCPAIQVETGAGTNVFEWWVGCGVTRPGQNNRAATDVRGKVFRNNTDGTCVFGIRAGSITFGQLLPTGARLRVPNIHYSNSTSANWNVNLRNSTLATRLDWVTTSAGAIDFDKCNFCAYPIFSQPYSVIMTDCGVLDQVSISECATKPILTRVAVGLNNTVDNAPINVVSCFAGVDIIDFYGIRYENESGDLGAAVTDCDNVTITRGRFACFGDNQATTLSRGATGTAALTLTRVTNSLLEDVEIISGLRLTTCVDVTIKDLLYADRIESGGTNSTNGINAIDINTGSSRCIVDGFGNLGDLANVHPYNAIVGLTASYDCEVKNIGTPSSPYDCGSSSSCGAIATLGGNGADHILRRCYAQNVRTGAILDVNSDTRCQYIDVWGDGADTGLVINGLNVTAKGLRSTNPTTGATAVYGSHFYTTFISTTEGRCVFLANEPTAISGSKLQTTSGVAEYTSTGQVRLVNVGDEVTWEMDYFWIGITSLNNAAPTFSGTNAGNHIIEFQYDIGSGWNGVWLEATGANLSGVGALTPSVGVKLKVRVRCTVAAATNAVINIRITATSNATDYQAQYPLPTNAVASVAFEETGSRLQIYNVSTATEIYNDVPSGTSWVYNYYNGTGISANDVIRIRVRKPDQEDEQIVVIASATGFSANVEQFPDTHYTSTTPSNVTVDYVNKKIRATGSRDTFTAQELIDIIKNAEATVDGIRLLPFAEISGEVELSPGVFTALTVNLVDSWQVSWAAASVTQAFLNGGNIVGGIAGDPVEDVVGGPQVTILLAQAGTTVSVGSVAPSEAQIKEWIMEAEIIPGWSMARLLRKVGVMTIAKSSGNSPSGGTVTFRTLNDDGDEMSATVDANGNRTAVTQGS